MPLFMGSDIPFMQNSKHPIPKYVCKRVSVCLFFWPQYVNLYVIPGFIIVVVVIVCSKKIFKKKKKIERKL